MATSLTGKQWCEPLVHLDARNSGAAEGELPDWAHQLLTSRGVPENERNAYLRPRLAGLPDPLAMADMQAACERLVKAIQSHESVVVYGDYDVDGVSSTSIMVDFLRRVGAEVSFYIPDRRAEGYGLNAEAIAKLATEYAVIVTVDCGITAVDEVAIATNAGADVIIVDHHTVPEELPKACAALNPHRPDCEFPYKDLCAAGVAFMLAAALRRSLREAGYFEEHPEPDLRELLDIVAIATVADMVPLTGLNRVLVSTGLQVLGRTKRTGLQKLMALAKIDAKQVSATDIGFRIGPRINARGRLSHAAAGVELLLCTSPEEAEQLAGTLETANRARRDIERQTFEDALRRVEEQRLDQHAGVVVAHPEWHPGVLGLVANRLVRALDRPVVVIGEGGKGSGRTVEGINLYNAIAAGSEHLERFGGHPAAAGVTCDFSRVEDFRVAFAAHVRQLHGEPPYIQETVVDVAAPGDVLSLDVVRVLDALEPFGQKNPQPRWLVCGLEVQSTRIVGDNHLKLRLGHEGSSFDGIAWGLGELEDELPTHVDVVCTLERNTFAGRTKLQLVIQDIRPAIASVAYDSAAA